MNYGYHEATKMKKDMNRMFVKYPEHGCKFNQNVDFMWKVNVYKGINRTVDKVYKKIVITNKEILKDHECL